MPIFEVQGTDGVYEVDAPDVTRAAAAFKKMTGGSSGAPTKKAEEQGPPRPSFLEQMHEEGKTALSDALRNVSENLGPASRDTTKEGVIEGILKTGSGLASAVGAPLAYPMGAARALLGQPLAAAIHGAGSIINPNVAATQTTDEIYNKVKGDVDLATMALGGGPRRLGLPPTPSGAGQVARAAQELTDAGMPVQIPRVVASENPLVQQTGMLLKNAPLVGDPIIKNTERAVTQLGEAVGTTAKRQGGLTTESAGDLASGGIKDWIGPRSKAAVEQAYKDAESYINPNVRTDLVNTRKAVADIAAKRQNARMQGDSKAINEVIDAVQDPAGLNYEGVKNLRTHIGDMKDDFTLSTKDFKQQELQSIYNSLTEDLKATTKNAGGPQGYAFWEKANKLNAAVQKRREEFFKIVGEKGDATPALVYDRLKAFASSKSRGDTTLLAKARQAIGTDWEDVVSGITGRLGVNAKGDFSPAIYLNDWNALSDAGKSILYGTGAHRNALDNVAEISHRVAVDLQKFANPSGTGRTSFAAIGATALWAEPITAISTAIGGNLFARVLASPAPASSLASWMRAYLRVVNSQTPSAGAALTVATRNLANTINSSLGANVSPTDFLRAIQGPSPARTQEPAYQE